MNANKALEFGVADGLIEDEKKSMEDIFFAYSERDMTNTDVSEGTKSLNSKKD